VETGFGRDLPPKLAEIYGVQQRLPASLTAAQVSPESVDMVINTHLHWDHSGWNTVVDDGGEARPYFPGATYVMHKGEVEHGRMQWERDRISYVPAKYEPLISGGQARLLTTMPGRREVLMPGLSVECLPGHTEHMLVVHIESEGEHACFVSDLLPTSHHLELTWGMAFDLDPMRVIEERKRFLEAAIRDRWLVLFPHDHERPLARLTRDDRGRVQAAQEET
jgi:glyoxylase-like metal-dependent hydrolase (beta-lactamase superfamily II)